MRSRLPVIVAAIILLGLLCCSGVAVAASCDCCPESVALDLSDPESVKTVQMLLALSGYPSTVDGCLDDRTRELLAEFQADHGLRRTGDADSKTMDLLCLVSAELMQVLDRPEPVEVRVEINLFERTLKVFEDGREAASFAVGVGKPGTPSPVGVFKVRRKSANWGGGFGVRFIELDVPWGVYGIHGTNKPYSVGDRLSGGCFRMHNQDVLRLYAMVEVGTEVSVLDPSESHLFKRGLSVGSRGSDVFLLQKGLFRLGYLAEEPDGILGPKTREALARFQAMHGLEASGSFNDATREIAHLRIIERWPTFW